MREITEEERICAVERSRRMYQTDMQSNWATARDQGRKEGREEGFGSQRPPHSLSPSVMK